MRGKRKLFNELIPTNTVTGGVKSKRDTGLDKTRDKMAYRYYFHSYICRKRYDDCLVELYNEFDKQTNTIIKNLDLRYDLIKQLINNKTTTAALKKKYPYYNWSVKLA
jgi:hypothetical protein